ncbi:MAG: LysR family transcriptional regulator [Oscillospiraceae bacterium]|nr:LysR family transcriptional regulator [Oscillospiraceae bacterium]
MYDEYLKTFICVAECGSFTKAAELLYLSPNAVKKRIGSLEESTGISLFERTLKGEKLTSAGKTFYGDAKNLVQNYNNAVERAKRIQESDTDVLKIGIMDTFADEFMIAKWFQSSGRTERRKTSMVFYGSSSEGLVTMLRSLGNDIDFAVDICDEKLAKKYGVRAEKISEARMCCAVPMGHRLFDNDEITPADLCGEKVAILKSGRNELWDNIIRDIKNDFFGIELFEIEKYSIKTFNRCENENRILFMTENSGKVYPFCRAVPLCKEYIVPFGIYIPNDSSENTLSFIEQIKSFAPKD